MIIKEDRILRLTIEYDNTFDGRDVVWEYLDDRFGKYNWKSVRSGPKDLGLGQVDTNAGVMIVEIEEG